MRVALICLFPCLLSAASLDQLVPRPAAPKLIQLRAPRLLGGLAPAKARVAASPDPGAQVDPLGRPRTDLPLIPYPDKVPARHRGVLSGF